MTLERFKELVSDYYYLGQAQSLAHWDMQVMMPPQGDEPRSRQLVTLGKFTHSIVASEEMADLLASLQQPETLKTLSQQDQALVRVMADEVAKARKIPDYLVRQFDEVTAKGFGVWVEARKTNNFAHFAPTLTTILDLSKQRAEAMGYAENRYDALLDEYEKGMTVAQIDPLFSRLKGELVALLQAIQSKNLQYKETLFAHTYPESAQLALCRELLEAIGYDFNRGRMDQSAHPFSTELGGSKDVRITVRLKANNPIEAIATALHEGGHALYEQGVDPCYLGTPVGNGTSLGIHESQSRLWENTVGRSKGFWQHFWPRFQHYFPQAAAQVGLEGLYQALNRVEPSLIRTEADEVTYNLHIMVRYELEKALINDQLSITELPKAWNARYHEMLGITPPTDADGCLQDVHWSGGAFGYFPTYTLGNLYAAQFYRAACQAMPALESEIAAGNLLPLKNWLNQQIHRHGRSLRPAQLVQQVTGEALNPQYFVDYLWQKYGALYGVARPQPAHSV